MLGGAVWEGLRQRETFRLRACGVCGGGDVIVALCALMAGTYR